MYDSAFQTDFYVQLNLYSPRLKYTMDVAQVDVNRFLYIHSAEVVPFSWIKLGIMEGTLIDSDFELRYLNPLIFMHAYSGWRQYYSELEDKYYGEAHYCAYFGYSFDITLSIGKTIFTFFSCALFNNFLAKPILSISHTELPISSPVDFKNV